MSTGGSGGGSQKPGEVREVSISEKALKESAGHLLAHPPEFPDLDGSSALSKVLIEKLVELTKSGKLVWAKLVLAPTAYFYRCEYRGLNFLFLVFPSRLFGVDLRVETLDVFGELVVQKRSFSYDKEFARHLVDAIEATTPRTFDAIHGHPFISDHKQNFVEKVLDILSK